MEWWGRQHVNNVLDYAIGFIFVIVLCRLISTDQPGHKNDVHIAGFSDQILRFIAERSDAGQIVHIEKMDVKYDLKSTANKVKKREESTLSVPRPMPIMMRHPKWRNLRVFISSTFMDMHGERDLLTRMVFPELRARALPLFIDLTGVDLRWGITEEETRTRRYVVCKIYGGQRESVHIS